MIKVIGINEFLNDPVFKNCFVCGDKKYCEFHFHEHIYRVCSACLKKENVKHFFGICKKHQGGKLKNE